MDRQLIMQLRSRRFALDDIVPLVESAADVIERLQEDMTAMIRQLQERGLSTDDDRLVEAARYRYLRDTADPAWVGKLVGLPASTVDAAIDAAIRKDG